MGNLVYNLIVRERDTNSVSHLAKIRDLAIGYGAIDRIILFYHRRAGILDFDSLQLRGTRPYGQFRDVVIDFESGLNGTTKRRWVVSPPNLVEPAKGSLNRAWILKDGKYVGIEVGEVYDSSQVPNGEVQTMVQGKLAETQAPANNIIIPEDGMKSSDDPLVARILEIQAGFRQDKSKLERLGRQIGF